MSARCCVCARHMYLRDNIWESHRRDQVRKKCFHFTEGHSSRKLFILCRRSRSAAVANGCAANQGTDILIADNILKSKSGQQGTNILHAKTKVPTSLSQKSWCKLFGWRLLNRTKSRTTRPLGSQERYPLSLSSNIFPIAGKACMLSLSTAMI